MRFKTELLEAIRDGRKTVTRRVVKTGECTYKVGRIYQATNRPRFEASGVKANSTKGWFSLPIKITLVTDEWLSWMTLSEARLEGLENETEEGLNALSRFFILWGQIHGMDWTTMDTKVWRIEFQRVPESWK